MVDQSTLCWPAEPWIQGDGREIECLFQEGEMVPLLLADPSRQMSETEVLGLLERITSCVNALAGIDDPEAFVDRAKSAIAGVTDITKPAGRFPGPNPRRG